MKRGPRREDERKSFLRYAGLSALWSTYVASLSSTESQWTCTTREIESEKLLKTLKPDEEGEEVPLSSGILREILSFSFSLKS